MVVFWELIDPAKPSFPYPEQKGQLTDDTSFKVNKFPEDWKKRLHYASIFNATPAKLQAFTELPPSILPDISSIVATPVLSKTAVLQNRDAQTTAATK